MQTIGSPLPLFLSVSLASVLVGRVGEGRLKELEVIKERCIGQTRGRLR